MQEMLKGGSGKGRKKHGGVTHYIDMEKKVLITETDR